MKFNRKTLKIMLITGGSIILVLLFILVFLQFSGQGEDNGSANPNKITLVYWGLWEPESVMQPLIDKYQDDNPHVEIRYVHRRLGAQGVSEYENLIYTRLSQTGQDESPAPDIVKINNTWLPKFENYLVPMPEGLMSRDEYSQRFFPTCLEDFTGSNQRLYAIPIGIDGLALYYNKDLLSQVGVSEPPSDWDSFVELSKRLTKRDRNGNITQAGVAIGSTNNIKHAADIISFLLQQNNADVISEKDGILTSNLSSRNAQDAFRVYKDFVDEYAVWSPDLHLDLEMFFRGELAMLLAPSWRTFDIIEAAPHIEFDVAPMPQLEGNVHVNYAMYWGEGVSKASSHPEEAWKFLKFLSEEENIRQFYVESRKIRAFGQPYPLQSLEEELHGQRYVEAIMKMAPTMRAWKMSQNPDIEKQIKEAISDSRNAEEKINQILSDI
jgi:ABC-type glycerol-3-phosphate transport system substrate-binding protein